MRILWMKPVLPYPPIQGTRRVTLQLLENLSSRHQIRLFARLLSGAETEAVEALRAKVPGLEVAARLAPNRVSPVHRALYRFRTRMQARRGIPPVEAYTSLPPLVDAFAREADRFHPDLVVVEYWYSAPYLERVRHLPRVLFAHDVEYEVRRRARACGRGRESSRAWGALEETREKEALHQAPFLWFLTEADRDSAVSEVGVSAAKSAVMPYGVDTEGELAPRGEADSSERPDMVLFFGSFAADFNRDAVDYLLSAIWPQVKRLHPAATLVVAGGGMSAGLRRRCVAEGAEVRGEVRDVRALLLEAAVVVVPLRYGGGLRIRLLESLALQRTVVGTPVGVLGMGPKAEREVLVGESPRELARQVVRGLRDSVLRKALGRNGRRWVKEHHGLDVVAAIQQRIVERSRGGRE